MKGKLIFITFVLAFALIICDTISAANPDCNYTADDDFNKGNSTGLNISDDQIQLSNNSSGSSYPFIWVPNSNEGTVSKVNTVTGKEVARYHTGPGNNGNPSRTTVDLEGNCWIGNCQTGTAVKIGLLENGGYIDRNHNGIIETSRDLDGNGIITSDEILPWGQDECVLYEVILVPGYEGNYTPGTYSGPYANDYYSPGPRGLAIDSKNNIWIGTFGTMKYYYVDGSSGQILKTIDVSSVNHTPYGAVIDQYGILWSSGDARSSYSSGNNILRLDPSNDSFIRINLPHITYGLALDRNNHLFVSGLNDYRLSRINILTGQIEWTKVAAYAQGLTVTDDGDVWSANNVQGTVTRYSNDGIIKATIIVGNTPSGVSVDNNGKVWAVDNGDEYIHRINPANNQLDNNGNIINGVELSKRIVGGTHYGYSDMTGVVSNTITSNRGTWTIIHDSQINNALWGKVSWNSFEPDGTKITVRVRSSNDKQSWSAWEEVVNGEFLKSTPQGRYLEVEVLLERNKGSISPVLYNLAVKTLIADVTLTTTVNDPAPNIGDTLKFTTTVRNNGPDAATNITVYPVIPAGFTVVTPSVGTYNNGVWTVGDLQPGETATLEVTGVVTPEFASRDINYSATESHSEYDPTNSSVSSASVYIPFSNVELNYSLKNGKPTLTVHNSGTDYAFGVAVKTAIPSGFIPKTSQGSYGNGLWYIGALSPGGAVTLTLNSMSNRNNNPTNPVNVKAHDRVSHNKKITQRGYYNYGGSIPPPENRNKTIPMEDTGVPLNLSSLAILLVFFGSYLNKREDKSKINKWLLLIIIIFGVFLFCGTSFAAGTNQTYNSTNDFNNGIYNNVNGSGNKLELSNSSNPAHNYIWVPNTNEGTVSKVDVKTGQEVARYRINPQGDATPHRITVDSQGNCWVSNRKTGTVVEIGLFENGGYIDRNHDGTIQTSYDKDHNGIITPDEILPWGQDECVLRETILIPGSEGTYAPGEYTGSYANYGSGITSLALDSQNNIWSCNFETMKYYYISGSNGTILKTVDVSPFGHNPYAAVIDKNGILRSGGNNLLRMDPSTGSISITNLGYTIYTMALDGNNHLFIYGGWSGYISSGSRFARLNITTGVVEWTKGFSYMHSGSISVTPDGDIWLSEYYNHWFWGKSSRLTRFSNDGDVKASITTGPLPIDLSVDSYGKVWVIDSNDEYIHRIDPEINGVDLSKRIVGGNHFSLGQMTAPTSDAYDIGIWTVIHDSLTNNAYWGTVNWNSYEPKGTKVTVRVRSSNDKTNWSAWEKVDNGLNLKLTPNGRYLEVEVTLEKFNSTQSPVVYDVTVNALDSSAATTDLGVGITGDKSSLNVGETVKLTINAFNNGPNSANIKVNYKIPFGLKLLSSQGTGTYNKDTGVWNVGILPAGGNAIIELTIQVNNAGRFVNLVSVYGNLHSASAKSLRGMVRAASAGDSNSGNDQASFDLTSNNPLQGSNANTLPYDFPDNIKPDTPTSPNNPPTQPPNNPPTPPGPQPPGPTPPNDSPQPTSQLGRDIAGVRDALNDGNLNKPLPEWNPTQDSEPEEPAEDPPWWLYAMIIIGALVGAALVVTPAGETLQRIINGILASLSSFWLYLSYLGYSMKKSLEDAILRILVQCGIYITPTLQELYSVPITGIGSTTIIGLGLRNLVAKYPWLEEYVAPALDVLDQLTYQELSQKVKEFFK